MPLRCAARDPRRSGNGNGKPIRIYLAGLNKTVETDIARDAANGKPRRVFRARTWVREFFEHHNRRRGRHENGEARELWEALG